MSSFTCPFCRMTTHHRDDVRERYCPECGVFVDDIAEAAEAVKRGELDHAALERLAAGTGFSVPCIQRALGDDR